MNEGRLAGRVGLFVAVGTIVTALLLLSFTKGLSLFARTYELRLRALSVAGLKARSSVLMSGVPIGVVAGADMAPDAKGVVIRLRIQQKYRIYADARFAIEQIGFLGDQYVAIRPQANSGPYLQPGQEVECEEPFNIQEITRSTAGLLQRLDRTVQSLDQAIGRVDATLLREETLTNLTVSVANLRRLSERAMLVLDSVDGFVQTNRWPLTASVSNALRFSEELNHVALDLRLALSTNSQGFTAAVEHFESASGTLETLLKDIDAGKGLAGGLLRDGELRWNVVQTTENLANLTSNLNKYGLLYRPKRTRKEAAPQRPPTYPGRNPLR